MHYQRTSLMMERQLWCLANTPRPLQKKLLIMPRPSQIHCSNQPTMHIPRRFYLFSPTLHAMLYLSHAYFSAGIMLIHHAYSQ